VDRLSDEIWFMVRVYQFQNKKIVFDIFMFINIGKRKCYLEAQKG